MKHIDCNDCNSYLFILHIDENDEEVVACKGSEGLKICGRFNVDDEGQFWNEHESEIGRLIRSNELSSLKVPYEEKTNGFVIDDKIFIGAVKNRWRHVGKQDWDRYFSLKILLEREGILNENS